MKKEDTAETSTPGIRPELITRGAVIRGLFWNDSVVLQVCSDGYVKYALISEYEGRISIDIHGMMLTDICVGEFTYVGRYDFETQRITPTGAIDPKIIARGVIVRHRKRGSTYVVLGLGILQDSGPLDMKMCVSYTEYGDSLPSPYAHPWFRTLAEMCDGRFEFIGRFNFETRTAVLCECA